MPDYQLGKIYKIESDNTDQIYIGSTCEPTLARRLAKHVDDYKSWLKGNHNNVSSFRIIEKVDYQIILLETYPCSNKDELHAREAYWIGLNKPIIVNIYTPGAYSLGVVEYRKQYQELHKDHLKEYYKQYQKEYNQLTNFCMSCGCNIKKSKNACHNKTQKHINNKKLFDETFSNIYI